MNIIDARIIVNGYFEDWDHGDPPIDTVILRFALETLIEAQGGERWILQNREVLDDDPAAAKASYYESLTLRMRKKIVMVEYKKIYIFLRSSHGKKLLELTQ